MEKVRYKITSIVDTPSSKEVINPSNHRVVEYGYEIVDSSEGEIMSIQTNIVDEFENRNERVTKVLTYYEQPMGVNKDRKFVAQLLLDVARQHIEDLKISPSKVNIGSYSQLLDNIE